MILNLTKKTSRLAFLWKNIEVEVKIIFYYKESKYIKLIYHLSLTLLT